MDRPPAGPTAVRPTRPRLPPVISSSKSWSTAMCLTRTRARSTRRRAFGRTCSHRHAPGCVSSPPASRGATSRCRTRSMNSIIVRSSLGRLPASLPPRRGAGRSGVPVPSVTEPTVRMSSSSRPAATRRRSRGAGNLAQCLEFTARCRELLTGGGLPDMLLLLAARWNARIAPTTNPECIGEFHPCPSASRLYTSSTPGSRSPHRRRWS